MFSAIYAICCVGILVFCTQCDTPITKPVVEEQPAATAEVEATLQKEKTDENSTLTINWIDSVAYCFQMEESGLVIESVNPLTIKISSEEEELIDCSEGGNNQLEMNFCSKAKRVLAARAFRHAYDSVQVVLIEKYKYSAEVFAAKQQEQAKTMFHFVQFVQGQAVAEGEEYEGGSMQPLIENEKATSLYEKYLKDIHVL